MAQLQVPDAKVGKRWIALEVDAKLARELTQAISGDRPKADKIGARLEGMLKKILADGAGR